MKKTLLVICILITALYLNAQPFVITDQNNLVFIQKGIKYFVDSKNELNADKLLTFKGYSEMNNAPVFKSGVQNVWIKLSIANQSSKQVYLDIPYNNISTVSLYKFDSGKINFLGQSGNNVILNKYVPGAPDISFNLNLVKDEQADYYIHVRSIHPIIIPMYLSLENVLINSSAFKNLFIGFYFGLLSVIFFYNLFLYLSTKDRNYLLYIIYIFCLILAQLSASGYGYFYLWSHHPEWNKYSVLLTSYLSGITAFAFSISFLHIHFYARKLFSYLQIIFAVYIIGILASLFQDYNLSYAILNYNSLFNGLVALALSIYITKQGFKPAIFYLVAWSAFLISVFILVLRNINILPYNNFTSSALYIGSSLEVILLSIALADRINTLKKEKETSQAEALQQAEENEILVREQNVILESKVERRTHEIREANIQLNVTLDTLKDAQAQLVDAEKMASLGQLTAGIAHEINNPINFVKSNINPLRLDVKDLLDVLDEYGDLHSINDEPIYRKKLETIEKFKNDIDIDFIKTEINNLIVGIEEGAERTAEIVRGLKTFSRIDEAELKTADIHDGISSTLVLLKNSMPYFIKVEKDFTAEGIIECYPGKLNQVFMNILNNGIQAIKQKSSYSNNECISVSTKDINKDFIEISIKDTGIGMTEEVKRKIYEPFFTTKEVGEGTGLGMAIVFKIVQKHQGKIDIISKPFEGSEFIITLPHKHPISDHF